MNIKYKEILKGQNFCMLANMIALKNKDLYNKLITAIEEEDSSYCASENKIAGIYMISAENLCLEANETI